MRGVKTPKEIEDFIRANTRYGISGHKVAEMVNEKFGTSFSRDAIYHYWTKLGIRPSVAPIGTEFITSEGYRVRKVSNSKVTWERWQFVHRIIWEMHYGPLPKDFVIIFRDGNKSNCRIDNLLLATRNELLTMNQKGLYSDDPDLIEFGLNTAKLIMKYNSVKKGRTNGRRKEAHRKSAPHN